MLNAGISGSKMQPGCQITGLESIVTKVLCTGPTSVPAGSCKEMSQISNATELICGLWEAGLTLLLACI